MIPIGSYIIATEEIEQSKMDRLFPTTGFSLIPANWFIIIALHQTENASFSVAGYHCTKRIREKADPKLHRDLVALFPELEGIRISHSWAGFVAYTFDELMHAGENDGIFFATGYCGSGVGMASYLGMRIGQQALGLAEGQTAFNKIPFNGRPYYNGVPWFLAPSVMAYRIRDKLGF